MRRTRKTTPEPVVFGLGSSLGDRDAQLRAAIAAIRSHFGPLEVASPYESEALLGPDTDSATHAPSFLNTAVVLRHASQLDPEVLLAVAKAIEQAAGRRSGPRWKARLLDIDLLLVGERQTGRPALTLPHPDLVRRRFALRPLAEIAPDLRVPGTGATVLDLDLDLERSNVPAPTRCRWSRLP